MRTFASIAFVSLCVVAAASCTMDFGGFQFSNSIADGGAGATGGAGTGGSCEPFCDGGGGTNPGGMGGAGATGGAGGTGGMGTGGMGTGGGVTCNSSTQCPGMDLDCEYRTCIGNVCGTEQAPKATPCSDNGGDVCDGMGSCVACGNPPTAPGSGMCPAECSGGCNGNNNGICVIDCSGSNECAAATLSCPAGYACQVNCTGSSACASAVINCPSTYQCSINCNASSACVGATFNCAMDGPCNLSCGNMQCANATLDCGSDECAASCQGGAGHPTVTCNDSCNCTPC